MRERPAVGGRWWSVVGDDRRHQALGSGFSVDEYTLDEVRAFDNGVLVRMYGRKRRPLMAGAGGRSPRVRRGAPRRRRSYPEDMGTDKDVCPVCGQPVATVVRRHKTLGAFVPVWGPGPCRNPKCESYVDEATEAEEAAAEKPRAVARRTHGSHGVHGSHDSHGTQGGRAAGS